MSTVSTPARHGVFHGWWIVAVGIAGAFLGSTTSQLFTGAMLPSIEASTGWSRSSITFAVTLGGVVSGLSAPLWGRIVDRHGPRFVTACGALIVALGLIFIGISSLFHVSLFYVGYMLARTVSQNTVSGVVIRTTLVNWFQRMRGRALGLVSMAVVLGGAVLIPIARAVTDLWGWEFVYIVFGIVTLTVMAPLAWLVLRPGPEAMGLLPDGDLRSEQPAGTSSKPAEANFTSSEAMRTTAFWMLLFSQAIASFSISGITFHQASFYQERGIDAGVAALIISAFALSGALANGLWGFLVEHVSERLLGAVTLFGAGLLPMYLLSVDSVLGAFSFAVLFGLTARGEGAIIAVIIAQYFGRGSYGAISGMSGPFTQVALGLGPTAAAVLYEIGGESYDLAFILNGFLFMTAAALIFFSRKPSHH